jgi:hypothetical protein
MIVDQTANRPQSLLGIMRKMGGKSPGKSRFRPEIIIREKQDLGRSAAEPEIPLSRKPRQTCDKLYLREDPGLFEDVLRLFQVSGFNDENLVHGKILIQPGSNG